MKFYIPKIGDKIILTKNWHIHIMSEYRNDAMLDKIRGKEAPKLAYGTKVPFVLPEKTILAIDRIYIKKGSDMEKYNSITFRVVSFPEGFELNGKGRFFVSLTEANHIEYETFTD